MARRASARCLQRELIALACFLAFGAAARAQAPAAATATGAPDEKVQEVVITGSRIARPDLDRLQPTTVVGQESFEQRGYTDVGQALSELPAFGVQSSSAVGQQTSAFGIAQSFVDLYSLGSQRTLTLVDGRRFVSSNSAAFGSRVPTPPGQQVDLDLIPTKLIDRVETVSVGGAPIYGADAIAGTVNIIMKKNYEGLDVDAQTGVSNDKDAWNYRLRALAGKNFFDDRGNVTAVVEYSKQDGLTGPDRPLFAENIGFLAPFTKGTYTTVFMPDNTVPAISPGGVPYLDNTFYLPGATNSHIGIVQPGTQQPLQFGPGGALIPYNLGNPTGNPIFWSGGDGIVLSNYSNLLSPTERLNADTIDNFKVNDHLNLFAETWFSEVHARNIVSQPAYNTTLFGLPGTVNGDFKISVNNPFLTPAESALIGSELQAYKASNFYGAGKPIDPGWNANTFYIGRASSDLQSNSAVGDEVLGRGIVGANGDFSIVDRNWNYEVAINYGYSRNDASVPAYVFQNVQNALNAVVGPNGQIECAPGYTNSPFKTASSTCAPLNVFGAGSPSQASLNYITHVAQARSVDTQRDAYVNLNGDVLKLPAGEWKAAVGFENRRETANFSPDSFYTSGQEQLNAGAVNGAYHTNEAYAETLVPIFEPDQALPLLHQVEAEGAIRRVDNSIAGSSTTWTAGVRWAPIQDVLFRGNKTVSIRAPAITELFLPPVTAFEFANDPCDKNFVGQGSVPALRQKNCASQGINTATFTSNVVNATARGTTAGNTNLQSETADAFTYGAVFRPHWVQRLNIAVDYIDIKMSNAIEQLNLVELMDACYDAPDFPNNSACSHFVRDPTTHQVTTFSDGFINAGLLDFKGITASLDYTYDLPWDHAGSLTFRGNYLDTRTLLLQVGSAAPVNEAGTLNLQEAAPKVKASSSLTWTDGPVSWYWQGLFVSRMDFNNQDTPTSQNILSVNPWWVINSTFTWNVTSNLQTRFIVNNVFNKQPPFPALAGTGGNYVPSTTVYWEGILGRNMQLQVDYKFF